MIHTDKGITIRRLGDGCVFYAGGGSEPENNHTGYSFLNQQA